MMKIQDAEVEFGAAEANALSTKEEVDAINKQMIEIGQGRIEGTKKNIEKAKKDVKDFKKKILKIQNDAKTAGRNRDKAMDAIKAIEVLHRDSKIKSSC